MYAINHASTALLLKKQHSKAPMFLLLLSVQLVELLWVLFTYLGIEKNSVSAGKLHLDFLPYSHSLLSGVILSVAVYGMIRITMKSRKVAMLMAIGVLSHVIIDLVFHEPDIQLSPFSRHPVFGFNIVNHPLLDIVLETLYGIFCWWYFKGSWKLLTIIVLFNLLNIPMMFADGNAVANMSQHPMALPTVILVQIIVTWFFVYKFSTYKIKNDKKNN